VALVFSFRALLQGTVYATVLTFFSALPNAARCNRMPRRALPAGAASLMEPWAATLTFIRGVRNR